MILLNPVREILIEENLESSCSCISWKMAAMKLDES